MTCPDIDALVESKIDKVATQYRESPRLLSLIRTYLRQAAIVTREACEILDHFDIDTAVGDQLTIIGKVLGWPRCHCAGQRAPVFGFACDNECGPPTAPIGGFCEAEWDCGDGPDYVEFCFTDDEMYRGFLKSRVITLLGLYTHAGMTAAARSLWGEHATVWLERPGVVTVVTGRLLSDIEISIAHLYQQVMPVAPGLRLEVWHSNGPAFGFGDGWGGFCDGAFPVQITIN